MYFPQQPLVVIDVSGPHAVPPANINSSTPPSQPEAIVRIHDLVTNATNQLGPLPGSPTPTPTPVPSSIEEDIDIEALTPGSEATPELPANKPITLYIWRKHTGPKLRVLNILPSLTALKDNEICHIISDNEDDIVAMNERKGMSSLHFTRKLEHRGLYHIELLCHPLQAGSLGLQEGLKLDEFTIRLDLHIL